MKFENSMKRRLLRIFAGILISGLIVASLPFVWRWWIEFQYNPTIYTSESVPSHRVAIVFGARVYPSGRLSPMLQDRVDAAIQLYQAGKVEKLLVSGDNRFADYDEPGHMMEYAIAQGVRPEDVQPDYAGRRTYDTCYRAKHIFQVESAVLVTQSFHLPRALFLCNNLNVESVGVSSDLRRYSEQSIRWSETREIPASMLALLDIIRRIPPPVLGEPIPI